MTWIPKTVLTMMGPVEQDPTVKDFESAPGVVTTINWGCFYIDDIEGELETDYSVTDTLNFKLGGKVDARQKSWITELMKEFKVYIAANSVYKNKAISIGSVDNRDLKTPKFIDTATIKSGEYILNESVSNEVEASISTLIKQYQTCKDHGVPIKRGILLTGPYGTGKTLVARQTAKLCVDNGWTFILVKDPKHLANAFSYSKRFSPSVVFVEDIDTAFDSNHRNSKTNDFLNTFDNIYSKNAETMFIMTSNHPEQLSKPMLRPGRVDCVVQFELPNASTVAKLIQYFAGDYTTSAEGTVANNLAASNVTPAILRELVERAKLCAIQKTGTPSFDVSILEELYSSMKSHLDLIEQAIDLGVNKKGPSFEDKVDSLTHRLSKLGI